jgi:hypothetical protein
MILVRWVVIAAGLGPLAGRSSRPKAEVAAPEFLMLQEVSDALHTGIGGRSY